MTIKKGMTDTKDRITMTTDHRSGWRIRREWRFNLNNLSPAQNTSLDYRTRDICMYRVIFQMQYPVECSKQDPRTSCRK